jgi:hypothetical protein
VKHYKIKANVYNECFIMAFENVFSEEYCQQIIKLHSELGKSELSGFDEENTVIPLWRNKNKHTWFSDGDTIFENKPGAQKVVRDYFDKMLKCLDLYHEEYGTALDGKRLEIHEMKVQSVEPGGGYHIWHNEHGLSFPYRTLATMTYLNTFPKGDGETEFLQQGIKIIPKQGMALIWPASFTHTHRGNPPYSQNKYTITSWFNLTSYDQVKFKHIR